MQRRSLRKSFVCSCRRKHRATHHCADLIQGEDFRAARLVVERGERLAGGAHVGVALSTVQGVAEGRLRGAPAVGLITRHLGDSLS